MKLCCGIDIGNAKTEVAFMESNALKFVRQPSVISYLLSKPDSNDAEESSIVSNLLDNLLVHISSSALKRDGLFFVGKKALTANQNVKNMNIVLGKKSQHDIPIITSLSMLAGIALKKYYNSKTEVPNTLSLEVKMATAIPSSEYSRSNAKQLEDRFKQEHTVTIYVGTKSTVVSINIKECKVTEEGKTSMLAFVNSDEEILKHYNDTYNENAVPEDFANASALHTDIGDGTSEFVYTMGFNPVANGSFGRRVGVGHATSDAIRLYGEELGGMIGEITRQHFMSLLQGTSEKSKIAKEKMKESTFIQGQKIIEHIQEGFSEKTSSSADYFFVHGGGSIVFKDDMYEDLIDYANTVRARVVWIPAKFATSMNSKGTFYLAKHLFCQNGE
ncbi:ParM/StbA family protein [Cytobacillus oceanisediminis]|uniref:ParM/StbA family protein n=1 Tax=Cytobacillus oceanisediminis TaxID=665099 RepID=UPI00203ACD23|nr:ParM/StbA family protein [Cytobacillus oceanisediminis]MCM3405450.1 ParM/StbA family protein [Cytobacillus oceanisediminis]